MNLRLSSLIVLCLLAGCEQAVVTAPECFGGDPATQVDRAVLWDGYSYQWEDLSHRISYLRAGTSVPDASGGFDAQMGILGGDWADGRAYRDVPHYANGHSVVTAPGAGLVTHYGEADVVVGADGLGVATVELDLDDIELPERSRYLVALRGVCIDADVPLANGYTGYDGHDGWTPRAFGARVSDPTIEGRGLSFQAELRFEAGALDRADLNAAIAHQRLEGTVRYSVLALDALAVARAEVGATVYHLSEGEAHSRIPAVPAAALTVEIETEPGGTLAFPVLRSWRHVLNADSDPGRRGRYLRSWTARLDRLDYDAETGTGQASMDMYLSHASVFQEGDLEVEHGGGFDFVVLDDAEATLERGLVNAAMAGLGNHDHAVPVAE